VGPESYLVQDGNIYTSAGGSAAWILRWRSLRRLRSALALAVRRAWLSFWPGSQAQFSVALSTQAAERKGLQELQVWIVEIWRKSLGRVLAQRAAMSARNFARVFALELGVTPAHYVEQARIEAARTQLTSTTTAWKRSRAVAAFPVRSCCVAALCAISRSRDQYRKHFRMPRRAGTRRGRESISYLGNAHREACEKIECAAPTTDEPTLLTNPIPIYLGIDQAFSRLR